MIVNMPDGKQVIFPDDTERSEIRDFIIKKYPSVASQLKPKTVKADNGLDTLTPEGEETIRKMSGLNVMSQDGLNSQPLNKLDTMLSIAGLLAKSDERLKPVQTAVTATRTFTNTDYSKLGSETAKSLGRQVSNLTVAGAGFIVKTAGRLLHDETFEEDDFNKEQPFNTGYYAWKANQEVSDTLTKFGDSLEKLGEKINKSDFLKEDEKLFAGSFEENPNLHKVLDLAVSGASSLVGTYGIAKVTNPTFALWFMSGVDAKDIFEESLEAGNSKAKSLALWGVATAGTAQLEKIGLEKVFNIKITKKGMQAIVDNGKKTSAKILEGMLGEGGEEYFQTVFQNLVTKVGYDDTRDIFQNAVESAIGGALGGGLVSSFNFGIQAFNKKAKKLNLSENEKDAVQNAVGYSILDNPKLVDAPLQENMKKAYTSFSKMVEEIGDTPEGQRLIATKKSLDDIYNKYYEEIKKFRPEKEAKANAMLIRNSAYFFSELEGMSVDEWLEKGAPTIKWMGEGMLGKAPEGAESPENIAWINQQIDKQVARKKQFEIIQETNPHDDSLGEHTWIKNEEDIKTAAEVWSDGEDITPDFTKEMIDQALKDGTVTVYSSKPIENGVFVTPSKMEAQNYAGGGEVYSKTVPLSDVAWIDGVEGQYAELPQTQYEFAGVNAKTAALDELDKAKQLDSQGVDKEEIRQQTGWFKGVDGKWRFEISDKDAKINEGFVTEGRTRLGNVLQHKKLYQAYPQLNHLLIKFINDKDVDFSGKHTPETNFQEESIIINLAKTNKNEIKSVLLHEIQHSIQGIEKFASGGSPSTIVQEIRDIAERLHYKKLGEFEELSDKANRLSDVLEVYRFSENPDKILDSHVLYEHGSPFSMPSKRDKKARKEYRDFLYDIWWQEMQQKYEARNDWEFFDLVRDGNKKEIQKEYYSLRAKAKRLLDKTDTKALRAYEKLVSDIDNFNISASDAYHRLYGEVEARNTESRMDLTEEERKATPPEKTQDVANADAIVVFDDGTALAYKPEILENDVAFTKSIYDIKRLVNNATPDTDVRVLYDQNKGYWFYSDAYDQIHEGFFGTAYLSGLYPEFRTQREAHDYFNEKGDEEFSRLIVKGYSGDYMPIVKDQADGYRYAYIIPTSENGGTIVFTRYADDFKSARFGETGNVTAIVDKFEDNKVIENPDESLWKDETYYQEEDHEVKVATGDRTTVEEQKNKNAEYNKLAKEYYGTTNKLSETGYILTDGSLLDFSGKKFGGSPNNRSIDHREIVDALENAGMEEFINSGNIRYLPEGDKILLSNKPTPQQYKVIERIINNNGGYITIELMNDANKWGMNRKDYYGEYEDTTFNKVKRDINAFYDGTGIREITQYYQNERSPLGAYINRVIYLNKTANASTLPHELAHFWKDQLRNSKSPRAKEILDKTEAWENKEFERKYKIEKQDGGYVVTDKSGKTIYDNRGKTFSSEEKAKAYAKEELFARGFEKYLKEGKAPNKTLRQAFANFYNWLKNLYSDMRALDIKLSPTMRNLYSNILGGTSIDTFLDSDIDTFIDKRVQAEEDRNEQTRKIITQAQGVKPVALPEKIKQAYEDFDFGETWKKIAIPLSTRSKRVSLKLRNKIRHFEYDVFNTKQNYYREIEPLLNKWKNFSKEDGIAFDLALKNGAVEIRDEILKKYDAEQDFAKVQNVLEDIYEQAQNAGLEVGYLEDYFPRKVNDKDGLLSYLHGTDEWSGFQQALQREDPYNEFTAEEQAEFIDKFLRGVVRADVASYKYSSEKARKLDIIDNVLNQYYADSMQALIAYIDGMNARIQTVNFFGRNRENVDESIGEFIAYLLNNNEIKPSQVDEVKAILGAVFKRRGVDSHWIKGLRDVGYIYTMGGINTAITQLDDSFVAAYKGGIINTVQSIFSKDRVTKKDLGLDSIAAEFVEGSGTSKAVNWIFKKNGIELIDGFGKNALLNGVLNKMEKLNDAELRKYIEPIMEEETEQTIKDIRNGVLSDNVRFFLFNELSDMQPVSLSELPELYNIGGNMRIFYMLKSFMLKRIDTIRNECYDKIRSNDRAENIEGWQNLFRLCMLMMIGGASKDLIIDLMYNRVIDLSDMLVNNLLGMIGISKYNIYQVREEGLGHSLAIFATPPLFQVAEDLSGDVNKYIQGKRELKDFEVFKGLPIVGRFYYWLIGGGKTKTEKKKKRGS